MARAIKSSYTKALPYREIVWKVPMEESCKKPPRLSYGGSLSLNGQSLASLKLPSAFQLQDFSFVPARANLVGLLLSAFRNLFRMAPLGEPVRRWLLLYKQSLCRNCGLIKSIIYSFRPARKS